MANSIANLAVIISGQTKPLEDAMKKAESKVGSFKQNVATGAGLGIGAGGIGMVIQVAKESFKAAINSSEDIKEEWEKIEKSFGNISASLWNIRGLTPIIAQTASAVESLLKPENLSNDWQIFKEQAASLFMSSNTRASQLESMRAEYNEAVRLQNVEKFRAEQAKEALEKQKQREELVKSELEAYSKSLSSKLDALDPMREELRIAEMLKETKDKFLRFEIEMRQMRIAEIEAENQVAQDMIDDVEEYYKKLGEAQDFAAGPITQQQDEQEKLNKLIEDARQLVISQIPEIKKLADMHERARKAFLAGHMNEEEYNAVAKEYNKALSEQNRADKVQLAGAATGMDAYSTLANAAANQSGKSELQTQTKELRTQNQTLKKIADNIPKPGDFAFGVYRMQL